VLAQKEITRKQWFESIRVIVLLRKLAEPRVRISDAEMQDEFRRTYGGKVRIRHIETRSLQVAQGLVRRCRAGGPFAELARSVSLNPSARDGGLLPPFGASTTQVAPAIRDAALSMKTVGEVSDPIQVGTRYHVLKLEEIIPPKNVRFDEVKGEIAASLRARKTKAMQSQVMLEIYQAADIQWIDPILKQRAAETARGSRP
jgi:parvulin-like peptidyl-prolyl isomerase